VRTELLGKLKKKNHSLHRVSNPRPSGLYHSALATSNGEIRGGGGTEKMKWSVRCLCAGPCGYSKCRRTISVCVLNMFATYTAGISFCSNPHSGRQYLQPWELTVSQRGDPSAEQSCRAVIKFLALISRRLTQSVPRTFLWEAPVLISLWFR
jgi:hypothetical protein